MPGGTEENHEIIESESECRNLNHVPSESEARCVHSEFWLINAYLNVVHVFKSRITLCTSYTCLLLVK